MFFSKLSNINCLFPRRKSFVWKFAWKTNDHKCPMLIDKKRFYSNITDIKTKKNDNLVVSETIKLQKYIETVNKQNIKLTEFRLDGFKTSFTSNMKKRFRETFFFLLRLMLSRYKTNLTSCFRWTIFSAAAFSFMEHSISFLSPMFSLIPTFSYKIPLYLCCLFSLRYFPNLIMKYLHSTNCLHKKCFESSGSYNTERLKWRVLVWCHTRWTL